MAVKKVNNKKKQSRPRSGQISRPLRRAKVTPCGKAYAECVLSPTSGPAKVPDGACNSVLIEYDLSVTGVPTAGGDLVFAVVPGLPCSARGILGTFTGPNRVGSNVTVPADVSSNIMFPFKDFPSSVSAAVSGTVVTYNGNTLITAARPVSYKLEVVPTGALLAQGGVAVTGRVPVRSMFQQSGFDNGTMVGGAAYAGASYHPYFVERGLVHMAYSNLSAFPDTKVCSGTESCVLIGIPPDYHYDWTSCPTNDQTGNITLDAYPTTNVIKTVQVGAAAGAAFGLVGNPIAAMVPSSASDIAAFGNFWAPEETTALVWAGAGLPASQAYTFRTRVCMELCVSHDDSTYRPFVTPSEKPDMPAISMVKEIVRMLPPSIPKPDSSPGWWGVLTDAVTGIGDFLGDLGLPVVSGVAKTAATITRRLLGH